MKTHKTDESNTALTSTLNGYIVIHSIFQKMSMFHLVLRAALIILITDYSGCDDLSDLNGVNPDGDKMEEMLTAHDFTVGPKLVFLLLHTFIVGGNKEKSH